MSINRSGNFLWTLTKTSATAVGSVVDCGVTRTTVPAQFSGDSSSNIASSACWNRSGRASPTISTGFFTDASGGRCSLSLAVVVLLNAANYNPYFSNASVAMIPGPPAFVRIEK